MTRSHQYQLDRLGAETGMAAGEHGLSAKHFFVLINFMSRRHSRHSNQPLRVGRILCGDEDCPLAIGSSPPGRAHHTTARLHVISAGEWGT